jgi:hypothetical protein
MNFRKNKTEIIGVLFLITLSIYLLVINKSEEGQLNKKGVYLVGKLFSSSSKGEISWIFKYQYKFNGKVYYRSFTGPLSNKSKNDSLMFFKILPNNPEICRQITTETVPHCLTYSSTPNQGWEKLPLNACK